MPFITSSPIVTQINCRDACNNQIFSKSLLSFFMHWKICSGRVCIKYCAKVCWVKEFVLHSFNVVIFCNFCLFERANQLFSIPILCKVGTLAPHSVKDVIIYYNVEVMLHFIPITCLSLLFLIVIIYNHIFHAMGARVPTLQRMGILKVD